MEYQTWWRNKFLTVNAKSIDEMILGLEIAVEELKAMRDDGVKLADGAASDYARLVTEDPKVAEKYKKYGFEENDDDEDEKVEFG